MHPIPTEETQSKTSCQEINVWRQRQNQDALPFKINSTTQADNRSVLTIEPKHELLDAHGQAAAIEILHVRLANIFGATGYGYNSTEINMFCNALTRSCEDPTTSLTAGIEGMIAMAPRDIIEAQLCGRLIVLSKQFNHFMGRAIAPDQTVEMVDTNLNRATKLGRLYNETLEALNRHKRKGEQKVTVQHVNVNNGGQAVVAGNFTPGLPEKTEGVPHANQ